MNDNPMDQIEMRQGLANLAHLVRHLHTQLVLEGFTETEALHLTNTWLTEIVRAQKDASA